MLSFWMSSLRKDPVVDRWVIIASERSKRPSEHFDSLEEPSSEYCPFCRGHEEATLEPVLEYPGDDGQWAVRVVPNRYPALRRDATDHHSGDGLFVERDGLGVHEVIIEAAEHACDFVDLSVDQLHRVMLAWRDRLRDLRDEPRLACVLVFKNHGAEAGATIAHAHSQLIGLPMVPAQLSDKINGARSYFERTGREVFADIVARELDSGARLVYQNDHIAVLAPWASRFPFELALLPRRPQPWYEDADDETYRSLAEAFRVVCGKLNRALEHPPYNLVLHSAPYTEDDMSFFRWHIELIPTLTKVAGFEWSSGYYVNPTPPEEAARHLRDIEL